jgi:membrane-associated phospholipid phosphatase
VEVRVLVPPPAPPLGRSGLACAAALVLVLVGAALRLGGLDRPVFLALNAALHALAPDVVWSMLSEIGLGSSALVVVLAIWRGRDAVSLQVLATLLWVVPIGSLLTHVPKRVFDLPRPPAVLSEGSYHLIGARITPHSFPSGHSLTAFTIATLLVLVWIHGRRWSRPAAAWAMGVALFGLAAAVALSRVAVAAHWPSDVCTGAGLGVLAAALACLLARRWRLAEWLGTAAGQALLAGLLVLLMVLILKPLLAGRSGDYPLAQPLDVLLAAVAAQAALWRAAQAWALWRAPPRAAAISSTLVPRFEKEGPGGIPPPTSAGPP